MPYPCPCGRRNEPARKAGECRYAGGCCLFLAEARRAPYGPANRGKAAACRFLRRSPALLAAFPVFERPLFACQTARAGPSSKNGMPQFQAASLQKQRRFWRALSSCVSRKAKPVHPQSRRLPRRGIAFRPCGRVQRLRSGSRMKVAPPRASCAKPDGSCGTAPPFQATRTRGMEAFGAVTPCRWMGRTSALVFSFLPLSSLGSALSCRALQKTRCAICNPACNLSLCKRTRSRRARAVFCGAFPPRRPATFPDRARGIARPLSAIRPGAMRRLTTPNGTRFQWGYPLPSSAPPSIRPGTVRSADKRKRPGFHLAVPKR